MTSEEYYKQGNEYRRQGLDHEAMNSYMEAIAIDPDSPAATARQMLEEQFSFYYKDYYNP